ncbi:DUF4145 domain-containing protein [Arthrobacter polaris]|uniref:DUF4145 domain-containing protein n=1 Tax=Arthrobacter polaris TaxID=2813727 RepID=UPI001F247578|nr:DUF4145 domain-containing protein [Arthrobacter polaris]UIK88982.1 DUF4145 domain-containing protein [Arthrobacter polaris]
MNIGVGQALSVPANFEHEVGGVAHWDHASPKEWAPHFVRGQDFPDVPEQIAAPASECHRTFSIGAVNSSVMLARAVIEAVAKDNGVAGKSLFAKIDALHAAGKIKDFTRETAHIIRAFGNDMAHGDFTASLDGEDAEGVLEFMDLILREVYQDPAKLTKLKAKAEARKASQP